MPPSGGRLRTENSCRLLQACWEGGQGISSVRHRGRQTSIACHLFLVTSSRHLQLTPEQREQQDDGKRNAQEPQQRASAKRHCQLLLRSFRHPNGEPHRSFLKGNRSLNAALGNQSIVELEE